MLGKLKLVYLLLMKLYFKEGHYYLSASLAGTEDDWATPVRLRNSVFRTIAHVGSYHTIFLKLSIKYDGYRTDNLCKFGRISMCKILDITSNRRK